MSNNTKKVFEDLTSLYDVADELENNGQEEDAINMRIKLNIITEFFVEKFKKDLEN